MDRRTLLAIVLCFLVYLGWQKFYLEPLAPRKALVQSTSPKDSKAPQTPSAQSSSTVSAPTSAQKKPAESKVLSTGTGEAVVGDGPRYFVGWNLKSYRQGLTQETAAVDLRSVTNQEGELELAFDDPSLAYLNQIQGNLSSIPNGLLWSYEDQNVKLTRKITSNAEQLWADLVVTAEFKTKTPKYAFLSLTSQSPEKDPEAQDRQLLYYTNDSAHRISSAKVDERTGVLTPVKYIGVTSRYFVMSVVNTSETQPTAVAQKLDQHSGRISLIYPVAGSSIAMSGKVYFGPKELDMLRSVEPTLDHAIDLGWFTWFAYPLLKLLRWIHDFTGNYGVAIILLTIFIKILTYPLTYKSVKSMKEMARLQPQLARLREKYKDDREALNREMLTMMRSHGYNPMAGCLPILIQMPVFFALYRVLWSSIELYHAPFYAWIQDLSLHDPYYVTPILLTLTMFIQQKLTPNTATDPAQQKMLQFMPVIFGAMMLWLPSGLTLYMLVNAIVSIIQQAILNKKFNIHPNAPVAAGAR
jgi:YidC/Oxa1 family membrane protein insertase